LLSLSVFLFALPLSAAERGVKRVETSDAVARHALVIGNSKYEQVGRLRNPVNDADAVTRTLAGLGFKVTTLKNADLRTMERTISAFGKKLRAGGVGLFFYAGHGMQVDGENFLIPVDANPESESDLRYEAVQLGRMLNRMADAQNGMNIVILDACRNNPFARSFRSSTNGLAQVSAPTGTFISYATGPGKVAADGEGENGLFTEKLVAHLATPGLKLEEVFKRVRVDVQRESMGKQVPWDSSSVTGDFFFLPSGVRAKPSISSTTKTTPQVASTGAIRADESAWRDIENSSDPEDFQFFLEVFPESALAKTAKFKLRRLERKQAKAEQERIAKQEEERKRQEAEQRRIAEAKRKAETERKRQEELAALRQKQESAGVWTEPNTGMKFRRIPGGSFRMGSPSSEEGRDDDETQHTVTVGEFWLGETEVTNRQYRLFKPGHDSKDYKGHSLNGDDQPVVEVNWHDAVAYAKWLSRKTGKRFRLPTEAEWEYAARAGTQTARYWGDGIGSNNANCDGCGSRWDGDETAPVRSFTPNTFGLFDMLGNVYEWTCSEYKERYDGSEERCSDQGDWYSLRGGAWRHAPGRMRAAHRLNSLYGPYTRLNFLGFRLARD
ncbi:MAG: SUMF1/EgtB/PvdO family nonheme iron enzyme, partial [SAR324 cluster bacterium]|nr:SUMF1/EgtB/PvdO family nonheme iron enzyme [SAR324 cluster bacterium]